MTKHPASPAVLLTTILIAAAIAAPFGLGQEKAPAPLTVAVLDFQTTDEALAGQGGDAATLLTGLLSANPDLVLVERAELEKVLGEAELTLSGTVSGDTASRVGQLTGAKVLVTGRMFPAGGENYAVVKIIGTETSRVFGQTAKFGKDEGFAGGIEALAEKVGQTLAEKSADLVAKVETPEERLTRLRGLVAGKPLPSVYVAIPEEHISRRIPDPAAQTEIQKTLQDVGFKLADSSEAADVVVTGEAFSETAGRRANLVSCRARVEVKVVRKSAKGELKVDRQTSVAVDLAENVAAKSALQNAGSALAERLIVTMVSQGG